MTPEGPFMPPSPTADAALPRSGGGALSARLERPTGQVRAAALFAHCFACSKDSHAARRISKALAARGIATLRFDMGGIGGSGDPGGVGGPAAQARDIIDAAAWMADQGLAPGLLVGHSLGGAAALIAAQGIASVQAVAVIGAPADPAHVLRLLGDALDVIQTTGEATVTIGPGAPLRVTRDFVDEARGARVTEAAAHLGRALLILHAPRDEIVGIEHASRLFTAAKHPKSFVSLDDADHLLTRAEDAAYAADLIAAWASRYLIMAAPETPKSAPEGVVRVTEADPAGFRQDILVGHHALVADEPTSVGGADAGPSPYGLVAAGLGACTAMTIRMYARRKGIALHDVTVDVTHAKTHAEDCAGCGADARIDRFDRIIRLTGDLSDDERARLMQIADRCPVHRTLESASQIVTRAADA
ncbi:MAG: putative redox protein [Paracoccaceae bacterium]|jgi:putative redox protein